MPRGNETRNQRAATQVERARKLYSQIGEPLPADIIIDLYRCLGAALEAADERNWNGKERTKRRAQA